MKPGPCMPGTCPLCKKGKNWASECHSVKDVNGHPIPQTYETGSKNGMKGPHLQGLKIFGALQTPTVSQIPMGLAQSSGRQPGVPQGWTSVPPPEWY